MKIYGFDSRERSTLILTLSIILSAVLHLRAEYYGPQYQVYVFKPLTMILILWMAARVPRPVTARYKKWIVAGLLCSLVGDVLLMLPADLFIAGLVCFLIAHLVYIVAFRFDVQVRLSLWSLAPFMGYGAFMFGILGPDLGDMLIPVLAYMIVILVMAWQAWQRWANRRERGALLAAVGALFFVISDSVLAVNRFVTEYEVAPALILITYFTAQWLIARSVARADVGKTDR